VTRVKVAATASACKNAGASPVVWGEMEGIAYVDAQPRSRADAFTDAVAPHYTGLVRRLTLVVGDREGGEDLAQDAYLRAYRSWDRFDGRDVRAWLHTIGLRLAFNERDRRSRFLGIFGTRTEREPWVDPQDHHLTDALRGLRREHRAALLLNVVDGYTQHEIALLLGVAPGTVASWLSRAKSHMREALTDD
jgi:RNA polymerase sigma-70 factor (ECF subfamily)